MGSRHNAQRIIINNIVSYINGPNDRDVAKLRTGYNNMVFKSTEEIHEHW